MILGVQAQHDSRGTGTPIPAETVLNLIQWQGCVVRNRSHVIPAKMVGLFERKMKNPKKDSSQGGSKRIGTTPNKAVRRVVRYTRVRTK